MAEAITPRKRARAVNGESGGAPGRATVLDVAQAAGVSTATVSRVLNGNYPVAPETRRKVERAVRRLGYVVNAHARALAGAQTRTVGIVVPDVIDPFFAFIAHGVQREAAASGRLCVVCSTHSSVGGELAGVDLLHEQRADVVVLVGGTTDDAKHRKEVIARAESLARDGSQLVLCGRPSLGPDVPALVVDYDNEGGAFVATEHLLGLGHRRIAYVGGPESLSTHSARLSGYRRAHDARGLPVAEALIQPGEFSQRFGYERTAALVAGGADFTAVFAANDIVALGVLQALREAGLRVPEDVSVVGYDDVPVARQIIPALTTVHLPLEQLGREAVRLAVGQRGEGGTVRSERSVRIGTHLVLRDTTAPPPR